MRNYIDRILLKINEGRDPAALGVLRFCYGLLMIIDIFDERGLSRLPIKHGDPSSCYFPLFDNMPRLSIEYLYLVYLVLLMSAFGIMIGLFFKLSCFCFMSCYWYIFFLDKTVWNNHSYLYGLMSIILLLSNANYYWSIDGLIWPSIRNKQIPLWQYGVVRFQVFLLYFYAGLKKLDRDWMTGYSMVGLSREFVFDPFRTFLTNEQIDFYMVHCCGLMFDLLQGFMLFFDTTRPIGFFFGYNFHIMNAVMFNIGMFSYMCMAVIPIFCRPEWPKKIIKMLPSFLQKVFPMTEDSVDNKSCTLIEQPPSKKKKLEPRSWTWKNLFMNLLCLHYVAAQLFLPYSHFLTKGYNSWTQGLYGYSWDMMIHSWSTQHVVVKVTDQKTNKEQYLRPGAFFPYGDSKNRIFSHPDMLKQYAICLADRVKGMDELGIQHPQITVDVWKSMNGRYQQRMLDPTVDLVTADWDPFTHTKWMQPLLVELSSWRSTLKQIRNANFEVNNATEIVFVADFPGLSLENYIAPEIKANVTVLKGEVIVQSEHDHNTTVKVNETLNLRSDETHVIHTVTNDPSCYMYVYYNESWVDKTDEELLASDTEYQKKLESAKKWKEMPVYEKFYTFMKKKVMNMKYGLQQIHMAMNIIIEDVTGIEMYPREEAQEGDWEGEGRGKGKHDDEL